LGFTGVAVSATPLGKPGIERQYQATDHDNCRKNKEKSVDNRLVFMNDECQLIALRWQVQTFEPSLWDRHDVLLSWLWGFTDFFVFSQSIEK